MSATPSSATSSAGSLSCLELNPVPETLNPSYVPSQVERSRTEDHAFETKKQDTIAVAEVELDGSPRTSPNQSTPSLIREDGWPSRRSSTGTLSCNPQNDVPQPPYHIFTLARKRKLVYIVSLAALFSPLSSNIYFPALDEIALVSCVRLVDEFALTFTRITKLPPRLSVLQSPCT